MTVLRGCGNNRRVTDADRRFRLFPVVLLAASGILAQGCTAWSPFTLDDPEGEVTVVGVINDDRVERSSEGCSVGGTLFWGQTDRTIMMRSITRAWSRAGFTMPGAGISC